MIQKYFFAYSAIFWSHSVYYNTWCNKLVLVNYYYIKKIKFKIPILPEIQNSKSWDNLYKQVLYNKQIIFSL